MSLARSCNHPNMTPLWQPSQASQRLSSWHVLEVISREIRMSSCYLGLSWCQPRCTASWLFSSRQGTRRDFVFRLNCEALFWLKFSLNLVQIFKTEIFETKSNERISCFSEMGTLGTLGRLATGRSSDSPRCLSATGLRKTWSNTSPNDTPSIPKETKVPNSPRK